MAELVFKGNIDEVTSAASDQSTSKIDCSGELLKIIDNTSTMTKDIRDINSIRK